MRGQFYEYRLYWKPVLHRLGIVFWKTWLCVFFLAITLEAHARTTETWVRLTLYGADQTPQIGILVATPTASGEPVIRQEVEIPGSTRPTRSRPTSRCRSLCLREVAPPRHPDTQGSRRGFTHEIRAAAELRPRVGLVHPFPGAVHHLLPLGSVAVPEPDQPPVGGV